MTITPEKLRRKADEMKAAGGALYLSGQSMASMQVKDWSEVLRQAADEIERLKKLPAPSIPTSEEYQQAHNEALKSAPPGEIIYIPPRKTLRDEFAMAAMSGFLANGYGGSSEELANAAYDVAFYMLKSREQK